MSDWDIRISHHFTLGEFVPTDRPAFLRLDAWGRTKMITNFGKVAHQLEIIRGEVGEPIHINSGWRSKEHNRAVGGAVNSEHMTGEAVDFTASGVDHERLFEICRDLQAKALIHYDQLIGYTRHVHLGMGPRMRGQSWRTNTA